MELTREEAADRAVLVLCDHCKTPMNQMACYNQGRDCEYANEIRAVILGDSAPVSTDSEKLAIAVKALEEIQAFDTGTWDKPIPFSELWRQARNISDNALKEIQG